MTLELNLTGDMEVFDGTETVTLKQPGGFAVGVTDVMRREVSNQRAKVSNRGILKEDIRFDFPTTEVDLPELGAIIAASDGEWIVIESEEARLNMKYICITRDNSLIDQLDFYRAVELKTAWGVVEISWEKVLGGVPGHLIHIARFPESDPRGHGEIRMFQVQLIQPAVVSAEDQIRLRGTRYKITSVDSIDNDGNAELLTAEVSRWPS